jgi:hypothetical protein
MAMTSETPGQAEYADAAQDWLIISIIFWVLFVLIVSIGYLTDPGYTPPLLNP